MNYILSGAKITAFTLPLFTILGKDCYNIYFLHTVTSYNCILTS